jgi:hypothetical protein
VPRAPLHAQGVTLRVEISRISSADIAPPSSLIRAHAPIQNPLPVSVSPRTQGLCRLLSAPAGSRTFPALSLQIFPHVLGPLPRLLLWCTCPFFPQDNGLPDIRTRRDRSRDYGSTPTAISVGSTFRGCSHSLMFRPVSLLATPIALTAVRCCSGRLRASVGFGGQPIAFALALNPTPIDPLDHRQHTRQPWLLRPRLSRFVTSPSKGYANRPFRAADGGGTCTLLDSQPCRLLPSRIASRSALLTAARDSCR